MTLQSEAATALWSGQPGWAVRGWLAGSESDVGAALCHRTPKKAQAARTKMGEEAPRAGELCAGARVIDGQQ